MQKNKLILFLSKKCVFYNQKPSYLGFYEWVHSPILPVDLVGGNRVSLIHLIFDDSLADSKKRGPFLWLSPRENLVGAVKKKMFQWGFEGIPVYATCASSVKWTLGKSVTYGTLLFMLLMGLGGGYVLRRAVFEVPMPVKKAANHQVSVAQSVAVNAGLCQLLRHLLSLPGNCELIDISLDAFEYQGYFDPKDINRIEPLLQSWGMCQRILVDAKPTEEATVLCRITSQYHPLGERAQGQGPSLTWEAFVLCLGELGYMQKQPVQDCLLIIPKGHEIDVLDKIMADMLVLKKPIAQLTITPAQEGLSVWICVSSAG